MPPLTNSRHLDALTGLRGFAAIWVVLCHYSPQAVLFFGAPAFLSYAMAVGATGITLFFMLSGFIMVHAHPQGAQTRPEYAKFVWKRLARVYPVHLVTLLFAIAFITPALWGKPPLPPTTEEYIRYFTLTHGWWNLSHYVWNAPNWTLSAEWGAYLFFPLLFLLTRIRHLRTLLLTLGTSMVVYLAVFILCANKNMGLVIQSAVIHSIPCFAFGVLAYHLRRFVAPAPIWAARVADTCTLLIPALIVVFFLSGMSWWLFTPLYLVWMFALAYGQGYTARFLSRPTMLFLGRVSFSLYMVHYLVLELFRQLIPHVQIETLPLPYAILYVGTQIILIALAAYLVYKLVEVPTHRRMLNWLPTLSRTFKRLTPPSKQPNHANKTLSSRSRE